MAARTRLCLPLEWGPGDLVSAPYWQPAMAKRWRHPTLRERLWLHGGDVGFGQEAILTWHEEEGEKRPPYLFKLRLTTNVRRAIAKVPWPWWEGAPTLGCQQIAETTVQLRGWSRQRRVGIVRTLKPVNPSPQDEFWAPRGRDGGVGDPLEEGRSHARTDCAALCEAGGPGEHV